MKAIRLGDGADYLRSVEELIELKELHPINRELSMPGPFVRFVRRELTMPKPNPFAINDLYNDTAWTDAAGTTRSLFDMTVSHRKNLRAWLLRNATNLKAAYELSFLSFGSGIQGEMAQDDFDRVFDELLDTDAEEWVRSTPLYLALTRLDHDPYTVQITLKRGPYILQAHTHRIEPEQLGQTHSFDFGHIGLKEGADGMVQVRGAVTVSEEEWS